MDNAMRALGLVFARSGENSRVLVTFPGQSESTQAWDSIRSCEL